MVSIIPAIGVTDLGVIEFFTRRTFDKGLQFDYIFSAEDIIFLSL